MTTSKKTNFQIIFLLFALVQCDESENRCWLSQESATETQTEMECTHLPTVELPEEVVSLTVRGDLGEIHKELLESCSTVQKLNLSNCNISEIKDGAFSGMKDLTNLILSNNNIEFVTSDMFGDLPSLTDLSLDGNNINRTSADSFKGTPQLRILNLQNNRLREMPTRLPTTLATLNLTGNNIEYVDVEPADGLENLDLCENPILSWPELFLTWPNLSYLCLGYSATSIRINRDVCPSLRQLRLSAKSEDRVYLQSVDVAELENLETLFIENYTIDNLKFLDLENLKILHLLNIKYLANGNALFPPNLVELYLDSSHGIADFLINSGKIPETLKTLSLKNTNITIVDRNQARTLMKITSLDISQNPIKCLLEEWSWILDRIKLQPSFLMNNDQVLCDEPQEDKGKELLSLLLQREKRENEETVGRDENDLPETIYTTAMVLLITGALFLLLYLYYKIASSLNRQQDMNMEEICANGNSNAPGQTNPSEQGN